jgi:hypothetical protein
MEMLDQIFIPEIAEIIRDYTYPDYRKMFDFVVRDINWVAGFRATQMLSNTQPKEWKRCINNIISHHVCDYNMLLLTMGMCNWEKRFFINKKKWLNLELRWLQE